MQRSRWLILFILTLIPVPILADQKNQNKPMVNTIISSSEFEGFEKCNISNKLSATSDRLIDNGNPIKKEESAWTYAIKSEVMGLPVKAMMIGVCDASGERACGSGEFLAVVIAKPLSEVRNKLKTKTRIDFTKQIRDKETKVTLRPILVKGNNSNESVLFCDPGSL